MKSINENMSIKTIFEKSIVKDAIIIGIVVGIILNIVNQGDVLFNLDFNMV